MSNTVGGLWRDGRPEPLTGLARRYIFRNPSPVTIADIGIYLRRCTSQTLCQTKRRDHLASLEVLTQESGLDTFQYAAVTLVSLMQLHWARGSPQSQPCKTQDVVIPDGFYSCLFRDDFNQTVDFLPSSSRWTLDLGHRYPGGPNNWGTGEVQSYTDGRQNIEVTPHGTLKITPLRGPDGNWTSSRIETTEEWDFQCRKGQRVRVEARIKLGDDLKEQQLGIWPAFWVLGSDFRGNYTNWPSVGEIDILESVNGEEKVWNVAHCGVAPGGPCNEFSGISHVSRRVHRGFWHIFAWEVDRREWPFAEDEELEESMSWFIDGRKQWTLKESDIDDEGAWEALAGNKKMLLLNVAIGGGFPDIVAGRTTPTSQTVGGDGASMEVDYVAAYLCE